MKEREKEREVERKKKRTQATYFKFFNLDRRDAGLWEQKDKKKESLEKIELA